MIVTPSSPTFASTCLEKPPRCSDSRCSVPICAMDGNSYKEVMSLSGDESDDDGVKSTFAPSSFAFGGSALTLETASNRDDIESDEDHSRFNCVLYADGHSKQSQT